jgi:hypothetical protein
MLDERLKELVACASGGGLEDRLKRFEFAIMLSLTVRRAFVVLKMIKFVIAAGLVRDWFSEIL